jgi:hypothetical protein
MQNRLVAMQQLHHLTKVRRQGYALPTIRTAKFLRFLYSAACNLSPVFIFKKISSPHRFFTGDVSMDIPYVVGGALLWMALVLMVKGLEKLERPKGERA